MKIFKFGGASVKDAESVKNVATILNHEGYKDTMVVLSAMGKMTNAFEEVIHSYISKNENLPGKIDFIRGYHYHIISHLFENNTSEILFEAEQLFGQLSGFLLQNKNKDYNFIYDQIIGFGELLSTKIVSSYLNLVGIKNTWIDVRNYIETDATYRDAYVNWEKSKQQIEALNTETLLITQGFLGRSANGNTTSLGREGSDFTAAIFAHCLNAESVTIWKDVDGVLNADPRFFDTTQLLQQIPYDEAIEMAFYGASVIHPKTLKPLENKDIPLYVRSFFNLNSKGTVVGKGQLLLPEVPCFILKTNQILVSISAIDFSFMVEFNLSDIFKTLHENKLKVSLIQNSALSFSVCIEDKFNTFKHFLNEIENKYKVSYIEGVSLYTIRHATEDSIGLIENKGVVLLKQATKGTVQMVMQ